MKAQLSFLSLGLAALLTGCGGGGSTTAPAADTANSNATAYSSRLNSPVSNINTAPANNTPSSTQGTATPAETAISALNNYRTQCGFSKLTENQNLSAAATNHSNYLLTNESFLKANNAYGHYEIYSNLPYFTGVGIKNRAINAGYSYNESQDGMVSDIFVSYDNVSATENLSAKAINQLSSAPYHMVTAYDDATDIGAVQRNTNDLQLVGNKAIVNVVLGRNMRTVDVTDNHISTFPCQGVTGVNTALYNEIPSPLPNRNLSTNPIGQPILVRSVAGSSLSIVSSTITDDTGNTISTLTPLDKTSDVNHMLYSNEAFVLPSQPLKAYSNYKVQVVASLNGVTQTLPTFTFKTGEANLM